MIKKKIGRPRKEQPILIEGEYACLYGKDKRHVQKRFKVISSFEDGEINLKLIPFNELNKRREELINKLSLKLGEKVDGKMLMKDILEDTPIEKLEKLKKHIDRGAEIKPREGCFFMEIKDKRSKKPTKLWVRK